MSSKSADRLSMNTTINCTRRDSINQTPLTKVRRGQTNSMGVWGSGRRYKNSAPGGTDDEDEEVKKFGK
jgi:hypothetical protein